MAHGRVGTISNERVGGDGLNSWETTSYNLPASMPRSFGLALSALRR